MFSKAVICVLIVLLNISSIYLQEESDEYIKLSSEIQLVVWDLEDQCSENAKSYTFFLSGKTNGLKNMIDYELELGQYLREQSQRLLKFADIIPFDLQRNFTILTKCGDYLLAEENWKMLNIFAYKNEDLQYNQGANYNETDGAELRKSNYEDVLQSSKDIDKLESTWLVWQLHTSRYQSEYPEVLKLVNNAAKQNDVYNAKTYWERMSDYENLYSKVDVLWDEIEPLYKKLHDFVRRRINHYYGTNYTEFIPSYLLGSSQGDDWSNIADIILPHPQLLYDINYNLLPKDIYEIYKAAENTTLTLNLGSLGRTVWKQSDFNMKDCESHVLTYCNKKMSHLLTCPNVTYSSYLAAHRNALHVTIDRLDYSAYLNLLRPPSAITEAVLALGDIFAVANLERYGLLKAGTFSSDGEGDDIDKGRVNRMNALLLLALRIFPRLAYTYGADMWRLAELEETNADDTITRNYWEIRKKYSGIEGITNEEASYLNDVNILRNKPYINKFIGDILQFQMLNHHQAEIFNTDIAQAMGSDSSTYILMLRERSSKSVPNLLNYHYNLDDISVYPLKEFFSPLFEYLETVPIEQGKIVPRVSTTTTSTTTTTTSTTTTTTEPVAKEELKENPNILKDAPAAAEKPSLNPIRIIKTTAQENSGTGASSKDSDTKSADTGMIAIIVVIVTLSVSLVAAILWKKYKRKPRTNNRRFET